jgi:hypothetical protein
MGESLRKLGKSWGKEFEAKVCEMDSTEMIEYEEREQMKREGWDAYYNSTTTSGKALGLTRVITAHYYRAREHLNDMPNPKQILRKVFSKEYTKGYAMDIDHYAPHWLFANGDMIEAAVLKHIEENFGYKPQESKYLQKGYTSYAVDD